ncbi:hypothetical protein BCR44DRAFT_1287287 [Catenaria anguillulae PL171]|uniref:Uncharacterized protein n=1 Tax=Catenaria anguillulae PL171 TaxID=765915 RepID=A0A1Y2HD48_9FUNG|nr:hypothetical protein BCR44DRAFT_1287287 [Catenaria anguillulae PL171]
MGACAPGGLYGLGTVNYLTYVRPIIILVITYIAGSIICAFVGVCYIGRRTLGRSVQQLSIVPYRGFL